MLACRLVTSLAAELDCDFVGIYRVEDHFALVAKCDRTPEIIALYTELFSVPANDLVKNLLDVVGTVGAALGQPSVGAGLEGARPPNPRSSNHGFPSASVSAPRSGTRRTHGGSGSARRRVIGGFGASARLVRPAGLGASARREQSFLKPEQRGIGGEPDPEEPVEAE
jgi:hypothetical protein